MSWETTTSVFCHLLLQFDQHQQDALLHDDIERGRRLVGEDDLGVQEGAKGDQHALLHAAAELVGIGFQHLNRQAPALLDKPLPAREWQILPASLSMNGRFGTASKNWFSMRMTGIEHAHRALGNVGNEFPPMLADFAGSDGFDTCHCHQERSAS